MKYLQTSKYCPMCSTKIHETQPLLNLKLDRVMQDIVYKLVPGLQESECRRAAEGWACPKPHFWQNLKGVGIARPEGGSPKCKRVPLQGSARPATQQQCCPFTPTHRSLLSASQPPAGEERRIREFYQSRGLERISQPSTEGASSSSASLASALAFWLMPDWGVRAGGLSLTVLCLVPRLCL